jgi:hypothetical protein
MAITPAAEGSARVSGSTTWRPRGMNAGTAAAYRWYASPNCLVASRSSSPVSSWGCSGGSDRLTVSRRPGLVLLRQVVMQDLVLGAASVGCSEVGAHPPGLAVQCLSSDSPSIGIRQLRRHAEGTVLDWHHAERRQGQRLRRVNPSASPARSACGRPRSRPSGPGRDALDTPPARSRPSTTPGRCRRAS